MCSNSPSGSSYIFMSTCFGVFIVVFPFRDHKSGPEISSVHIMSALMIGQLGMRLSSTDFLKSLVLGQRTCILGIRVLLNCESIFILNCCINPDMSHIGLYIRE